MKRHLFAAAAALALSGCAAMGGGDWVTLIDADKGLENFTRDGDANWHTEGGAIVADRGKGGFLVSKQSFGDYQLRIEFFPDHNTNSGIYMRCSVREKLSDKLCHEANIFDQRPDPTFGTGGIVHIVTVMLNGVKTAEIDNAQFLNGPIALQFGNLPKDVPGGAIRFRKVQVRPL